MTYTKHLNKPVCLTIFFKYKRLGERGFTQKFIGCIGVLNSAHIGRGGRSAQPTELYPNSPMCLTI